MTLHTSPGCTLSQPMDAAGDVLATTYVPSALPAVLTNRSCDTNVNYNSGCGVMDTSDQSYGSGFNAAGGGVFVMYWDVTGISIWRFLVRTYLLPVVTKITDGPRSAVASPPTSLPASPTSSTGAVPSPDSTRGRAT